MYFNEYQYKARTTATYPNIGGNFTYPILGLCGEAGEVAEKCKKIIRDQDGIINEKNVDDIKKELGDVLWYLANLAEEFNLTLSEIAETNIKKLLDRQERNMLSGSGDDR